MTPTSGFCISKHVCKLHESKKIVRLGLQGWAANEFNLGMYACPHTRCSVFKHSEQRDYDLLVSALPPRKEFKTKKSARTMRHVKLSMQSSVFHPSILDPASYSKNGIDMVVSFRPPVPLHIAKWLPTSYINAELDAFLMRDVNDNRWLRFEDREPSLAVIISNCAQKNVKRMDIAQSLMNFFPQVYTLGKCFKSSKELPAHLKRCLKLPRRSAMWDAPKECLLHYAMFSFSLENSAEQSYITEKLWQPLKMGAIPIYTTEFTPQNRHALPHPDAALLIEDFNSLEHLASYMLSIVKNKTLWFKHAMAWRSLPPAHLSEGFLSAVNDSLVSLPCRLCDWWLMDTEKSSVLQASDASFKVTDKKVFSNFSNVFFVKPCMQSIFSRVRFPQVLPFIEPGYGIDGIFVVHYKPLKHRRQAMHLRVTSVFNSPPTFVEELDRDELSDADFFCASDRHLQHLFIKRHTTRGEDSLTFKHMAVFNFIIQRNITNALVLEDDATFLQKDWISASSQWQHILQELPKDYDMVMLSRFKNFHRRGKQISNHLFLAQKSRVSSAYLISNKGAMNMLRTLPIVSPIDFQINYAGGHQVPRNLPPARVLDIKILWAEPPMCGQYDDTGLMRTVSV
jgi:GR25 family glycosyltransferase involved in LPS biosynthesis